MKVFLAGTDLMRDYPEQLRKSKYQLASFYSIKKEMLQYLDSCDEWLLDSGAFTFMRGKREVDFDTYIRRYAKFIKENNVKRYFELDLDSVIGIQKTIELRSTLEDIVGAQSIPVWHKCRGINEWKRMCECYKYVAIGGIVTKEIVPKEYEAFPHMIAYAHKKGTRVHGLGFTSTSWLHRVHFDTIDSTTWNVGGKYGNVCSFEKDGLMRQSYNRGKRCVNQKALMLHNWNEWCKFQKYAETHL